MKARFGLAALDAIKKNYDIFLERLIKGYEKVMGKKPEGLDLTMIKREAYQKAEDSAKVVDMEGKTLDPSKPIMGGKQMIEEDVVVSKGPRPFGDNIRDAYKGAGRSREEASEMIEALDSPGAKKSYEIMEEALGVRLYGDETFEELMKIKETGVHPRGEPPIKKAEGGIIGEIQNLIGAGLESGSDFASGAGKFILGAASGIPGIGLGISALQNLNQNRFSNLPIGDQLFITEQMGIQGLDDQSGLAKDKYGYNIRSMFGNYADLVRQRAALAQKRGADRQRDIDRYYTRLAAEQAAAEAEAQRRAQTAFEQAMASGQSFYDSLNEGRGATSTAESRATAGDAPGYSGPSPFADGGIATMFVERR